MLSVLKEVPTSSEPRLQAGSRRVQYTIDTVRLSLSKCHVLSEIQPTSGLHGICGLTVRVVTGTYNAWLGIKRRRQCSIEPFVYVAYLGREVCAALVGGD